MTVSTARQLVTLIKSVARLGWPAEQQVRYLQNLAVAGSVDELALEFDDAYRLSSELAASGYLSAREASILVDLDQMLGDMSGVEHRYLWTEDALRTSREWQQVRSLADTFFAL